jgi:hypothetical protein
MRKYRDPLLPLENGGSGREMPYISVVVKEASRWAQQWHNRVPEQHK